MDNINEKHREFSSLKEIVDTNAKNFPFGTAFNIKDPNGNLRNISHKKFQNEVRYLSTALFRKGLERKNIALSLKNSYEWCLSYFSVSCALAVCVPLDKEMIAEDIFHIIEFAEIKAFITDKKTALLLLSFEKLPSDFLIISTDNSDDKRIISFESLLEEGKKLTESGDGFYYNSKPDSSDLSAILFTSGTTGMAKGVMLTQKNILSDIYSVVNLINITEKDSTLCILPLHHAYQSIVFLMMLSVGGSVSFCENLLRFSSDLLFYKPTIFVTVPLMLEKIHKKIMSEAESKSGVKKALTSKNALRIISKIAKEDVRKKIFTSIHKSLGGNVNMIITGAAKMNENIAKDYFSFGIPVIIGYGLTECSPIAICNTKEDARPDSIGRAVIGAQAKIHNPDNNGIGEIIIKGPMVMKGYYKNEKETEKVLRDGWLYTGDMGYMDENGYFYITGRIKNVIVTKNGKNIYPEELEYYLNTHKEISDCLVYKGEGEEETVSARIFPEKDEIRRLLKKDNLTDEEIYKAVETAVKKVNALLPSYKSIKSFEIQKEDFDRTSTHKIKRNY